MPAQHEIDPAVFERQHQIGVFLAGDAEDALDTLRFEAADK